MNVAAKVAEQKRKHPERFCPAPRCLWRTEGERCPRHSSPESLVSNPETLFEEREP
jgi:hypothetical protein